MRPCPLFAFVLALLFAGRHGSLAVEPARGPVHAPTAPPNFLVILADDLGFSDLGCFGGEIATPRLDGLAREGLRFRQFYNTARCWPTRAALLTGYYPQAIRRDALPGVTGGGTSGQRPPWARLLPEYLRPLGYRTYHSGKWHVDGLRLANGFDRSYSLDDHDRNFGPRTHFLDDVALPAVTPGTSYYSTRAIAEHARECLREHARDFPGRPFFQFLAFTVPHFPLQAPPEAIARVRVRYAAGWDVLRSARLQRQRELGLWPGRVALPPLETAVVPNWNLAEAALRERVGPGEVGRAVPWAELNAEQQRFQAEKMAIHAAMVEIMDEAIGRVLDQVRAMGAWDNTVVLFLSDNGASAEQIIRGDGHERSAAPGSAATFLGLGPGWSTAANTPFRLHKSWVHEGGIHTPLIVSWPAGVASRARGTMRDDLGHVIDLAPTLLALAGGAWPQAVGDQPVPAPHGHSLVDAWTRERSRPARTAEPRELWWLHEGHRAFRRGNWKLVAAPSAAVGEARWELYDLQRDPNELRDVAARFPERVGELAAAWARRAEEFRRLAAPAATAAGAR